MTTNTTDFDAATSQSSQDHPSEQAGAGQVDARLADVLEEIAALLNHFIRLPTSDVAMLIALWIVNTYTYLHFQYCGYLALRSDKPQRGKTKLERLIAALSKRNPPITATPTAATLFRSRRTVHVIDEVD